MVERTLSHYTLIERLGAGGMGVVWRARDQRLERDVALKVLREDALTDDQARARFRREALAVSQLLHPNVGTIFDFDREDGTDFLVMEYIPGECLEDRIARGPLPIAEAVDLGLQIAVALEASHELGVVHCDLKPANVVVTPKGVAKVLDFGLARLLSTDARSFTSPSSAPPMLAGTLPYMAPEQLAGSRLDPRTDVWALGTILYEMITGRRAFDDPQPAALIYAIMNAAPVAPLRLRPEIPAALEATILRALEKAPAKRHAAAADLALELRAVLLGHGAAAPVVAAPAPATHAITSLAVLPLANLSGDPGQEFFADGMTEALIADLARIRALRVISRSSVMQYKGSRLPVSEIARRLRVDAVVEGSVVRSPERVRVTAQLVDAVADRHLWANSYERDVGDVVTLQSDVARAIAEEIRVELTPREQARLTTTRTVDPRAFDATLEGRWYWNRRSAPEVWKGIEYFHRALEIDPSYAPAHAGLADSYMILGDLNVLPPREATIRARESASRALSLDDQLAEAHTSLGFFLHFFEWDWEGAGRAFRQAIALNPGYATAHQWHAELRVCLGNFDEALAESHRALELDPLSPVMTNSLADVLYFCRRFDECIALLRRTLEERPELVGLWSDLGRVCAQVGRHAEAIDAFRQLARLEGVEADEIAGLGHAYAVAGRVEDARRVLARLEERARRTFLSVHAIAVIQIALGEHERAFEWLERGFEERDRALVWLRVHPRLDPLRGRPRFDALIRRMKLA